MTRAAFAQHTDEELAAVGSSEAFLVLYDRHAHALLAFLATRVPSADLEDIHQDVWLRVHQHLLGRFQGGNFRAWLFRIARNRLIDVGRRPRVLHLDEALDLPDGRGDSRPESALLEEERQRHLESCLAELKKHDAAAATLVCARMDGEGYEVLGPRLGLTRNAAYKLWHRAVRRLQTCIDGATR